MNDQNKIELFKQSLEKHMDALHSASQSYDKAILSLATATLGFTFAFIKLVSVPALTHCCMLAFTWFFLILSISFILASFLIDQLHCDHKIKFCYWRILNAEKKIEKDHWSDDWMPLLSIAAGICFIIGIILFTVFVGLNIL